MDTALSTAEDLTKTARARQVLAVYEVDVELDGNIPTLSRDLMPDDRRLLQDRNNSLIAQLRGCGQAIASRDRAVAAIGGMFRDGWPLYFAKMESPKQVFAAYLHALQGYPVWAVETICTALAKGLIDDVLPDFPPAAARMSQLCEEKIGDMKAEKARFSRVLSIKDIRRAIATQEERNAAIARYEEWKAGQKPDPQEAAAFAIRQEEAKARSLVYNERIMLREYSDHGMEPIRDRNGKVVSLHFAKMMGIRNQPLKAEMDR